MQTKRLLLGILPLFLFFVSCNKDNITFDTNNNIILSPTDVEPLSASHFPESFDAGSKNEYAAADVTLPTGVWNLNDALIGNTSGDAKFGTKSVRIQNNGTLIMKFDVTHGATSFSVYYAKYGTEANSAFQLWSSVNAGSSWEQIGGDIPVTTTTLTKASFSIAFNGNVRFQIRKISGGILNIDFIDIQENPPGLVDDNMTLGNPSAAVTNISYPNNYLLVKHQYALSYNNARGTANWVSWNVGPAWNGSAPRCDCFSPDIALPPGFYMVTTDDYTGSGFDRGHQCPSADRTLNNTDNAATFLMPNIMPQAPTLNQGIWADLENYCRTLVSNGNELYVISGGYGIGGTGSNGGVTNTIAGGLVTVPANCWKVIVVLPLGTNDLSRVTTSTRVIAINMPNNQTANSQPWGNYRVSVVALESILGYNFLSNVSPAIQAVIEANADTGPTH